MDMSQINYLMVQEKYKFLHKVNISKLGEDFQEDLILFDEPLPNQTHDEKLHDVDKIYFRLKETDIMRRTKRKRYTKKEVQELFTILLDFPGHQLKIREILQISGASYPRLMKRVEELKRQPNIIMGQAQSNLGLTPEQKIYISRLVQPPALPSTIQSL